MAVAPLDLALTLGPLAVGPADPSLRLSADEVWWACRYGSGPATLRLVRTPDGVDAEAWGDGADEALARVGGLVGADDDPGALPRGHALVDDLADHLPGLRIGRSGALVDAVVRAVARRGVSTFEAARTIGQLVEAHGEPAPGPGGLLVAPAAGTLASLDHWSFHLAGFEHERADVIRRVAARAGSLERLVDGPAELAAARLLDIPGVGQASAATAVAVALGDPDAVPLGDPELSRAVCWALARDPDGDDERLLELLAPFAGQRGRVLRLLAAAGLAPPRRGATTHPG
ncbi:MAG TPA: hypothetical protein VK866_09755 [Acidimicrobiales bacterium]|nr:hypothetical protein [Acidimicrobiales bacterium]